MLALASAAVALWMWSGPDALRIATFNIEMYPNGPRADAERRAQLAFDEIERLQLDALGVEEIMDSAHFTRVAHERLGASWRFVAAHSAIQWKVGVLYNDDALELLGSRTIEEPALDGRRQPALEVRLRPRDGGAVVRIVVLHLQAGGAPERIEMRARQLAALAPVLEVARRSGDRLVVLGDFNATSDEDRAGLAQLSKRLDVEWSTEPLACTAFWERTQDCVGSALDHVLVQGGAASVKAEGACAAVGCAARDRCPAYVHDVSDHCPVVVELSR